MTPTGRLSLHQKIDVCRGLFAALVVVAHGIQIAWAVHGTEARMAPAARDALDSLFRTGTIYVMGFFVISGYCIHLSVARLAEGDGFPLGRYLVARLSRILPLYYVALLFAVAVERAIAGARPETWPHGVEPGALLGQLVLTQNLTETYGSFAPSWSITNEAFYYAFYGLLAWLAAGRSRRAAWAGMAACAAVAVVTQGLYVTVGRNPYVYNTGELFGLGIVWFQGVLVAVYGPEMVKRRGVRVAARLWPLALAAVVAWKFFHLTPHGVYLIAGLAFTLLLIRFHDAPAAGSADRAGGWRPGVASTLGLTSYPMYLFHGPLMMLVGSWVLRSGAVADWRVTWALLVAVGLGSGLALGWVLERPLMAWRAGLLKRLQGTEPRGAVRVPAPTVAGARS